MFKRVFPVVLVFTIVAAAIVPTFMIDRASALALKELPNAHIIANLPWHEQLNGLSCGAASLEIAFDYWGPDIDQKSIMNVARTSSMGTWTPDIVRAGHFSYLSDAQGMFFPSFGPNNGFENRPLGYAAFSYSSSEFWLNDLKALVANDIPVIVLMKYYPWGGGGHYRVVIGYDDDQQLVYFSDPWGRDLNHLTDWTGVISWSYADFQMGWNYNEYSTANPYFGAAIIPWSIDISVKGQKTSGSIITVTANVEYLCPTPFANAQYPAESAISQIVLPEGMTLLDKPATVSLGTLSAGTSTTVRWKALCNTNVNGKSISVSAWGLVSGWVPDAHWQGQTVYYPAYNYTDAIGAEKSVILD